MRFSIRDILLVTVIVAVLTGWGLDRWRLARRVQEQELRSQRLLVEAELARAEALLQRDVSELAVQRLSQQAKEPPQELSSSEAETPAAAK